MSSDPTLALSKVPCNIRYSPGSAGTSSSNAASHPTTAHNSGPSPVPVPMRRLLIQAPARSGASCCRARAGAAAAMKARPRRKSKAANSGGAGCCRCIEAVRAVRGPRLARPYAMQQSQYTGRWAAVGGSGRQGVCAYGAPARSHARRGRRRRRARRTQPRRHDAARAVDAGGSRTSTPRVPRFVCLAETLGPRDINHKLGQRTLWASNSIAMSVVPGVKNQTDIYAILMNARSPTMPLF